MTIRQNRWTTYFYLYWSISLKSFAFYFSFSASGGFQVYILLVSSLFCAWRVQPDPLRTMVSTVRTESGLDQFTELFTEHFVYIYKSSLAKTVLSRKHNKTPQRTSKNVQMHKNLNRRNKKDLSLKRSLC